MSCSDKNTFQRISALKISIRSQGDKNRPLPERARRTSSVIMLNTIWSCTCADGRCQFVAHEGIVVQRSRPESRHLHPRLLVIPPIVIAGMNDVFVLVLILKIDVGYRPRRLGCHGRKHGRGVSDRHGVHSIAMAVSLFGGRRLRPPTAGRDTWRQAGARNTSVVTTQEILCIIIWQRKNQKGYTPQSNNRDGQTNRHRCIDGKASGSATASSR